MSTSGMIEGAAAGATVGGGGWGSVAGGVIGGVAGALGLFDPKAEEVRNIDVVTPYKVRLPSGAVITMYAHSNGGQKKTGGGPSTGSTVAQLAGLYSTMNKKSTDPTTQSQQVPGGTQTNVVDPYDDKLTYTGPVYGEK